jgi:hypothetical protein
MQHGRESLPGLAKTSPPRGAIGFDWQEHRTRTGPGVGFNSPALHHHNQLRGWEAQVSAFVQEDDHIDLLVTAAIEYAHHGSTGLSVHYPDAAEVYGYRYIQVNRDTATEIGRKLLAENVQSVCHRYGEGIDADEYAGYATSIENYQWRPVSLGLYDNPAALILKACDGYEYQSCEHDGWAASEAKAIVDAIRSSAISHVPGYDEADSWSFVREPQRVGSAA